MEKRNSRSRMLRWILPLILLLALIGAAAGKYIRTIRLNGSVIFSAKLAETMVLQESEITLDSKTGTYGLSSSEVKYEQTIPLIPGVDIPKDPHIVISGKTPIEAYLYIEIVDALDTVTIDGKSVKLIDYSVENCWEKSTAFAAKHGGEVYVYTGDDDEPDKLIATPQTPIYILAGNKVTVSQYVKSHNITTNSDEDTLKFYAYLIEATN